MTLSLGNAKIKSMPDQFDWSPPNLLMLGAAFLLKEFARKYPLDDGDRAKARDIAKALSDAANSYVWKPAAAVPPRPRR